MSNISGIPITHGGDLSAAGGVTGASGGPEVDAGGGVGEGGAGPSSSDVNNALYNDPAAFLAILLEKQSLSARGAAEGAYDSRVAKDKKKIQNELNKIAKEKQKISGDKSGIASDKGKLAALEKKEKALKKQLDELQGQLSAAENQLGQLNRELKNAKTPAQKKAIEGQITACEQKIKTVKASISSDTAAIAGDDTEAAGLHDDISKLQADIKTAQAGITTAQAGIGAAQDDETVALRVLTSKLAEQNAVDAANAQILENLMKEVDEVRRTTDEEVARQQLHHLELKLQEVKHNFHEQNTGLAAKHLKSVSKQLDQLTMPEYITVLERITKQAADMHAAVRTVRQQVVVRPKLDRPFV